MIPQIPGLDEWMEAQFQEIPRPSFREIEERLRKTPFWDKIRAAGYRTGKSSIYTHWVRWSAETARKRVLADYAKSFNAAGEDDDALAIERAISGVANNALMDAIQQETIEGGITEKAADLIELHRKLQTSSARREAERRAAGVKTRAAYAAAREEIIAILEKHPEALRLVLAAIDNAEQDTETKHDSPKRREKRQREAGGSKDPSVQSLPQAA